MGRDKKKVTEDETRQARCKMQGAESSRASSSGELIVRLLSNFSFCLFPYFGRSSEQLNTLPANLLAALDAEAQSISEVAAYGDGEERARPTTESLMTGVSCI